MKNYLLALVLLFGVASCAEAPDDYVSEDLEVITQATQAFVWPTALWVQAGLASSSSFPWAEYPSEYYGFVSGTTNVGTYHHGASGANPTLGGVSTATACTKNTTFGGWICDGTLITCPKLAYYPNPLRVYYAAGNGVYAEGWYPWSTALCTVGYGGVAMSGTPYTNFGVPGAWKLVCKYPVPSTVAGSDITLNRITP